MEKLNILIFKDSGLFYGSLEKLLQLFAKILSRDFNVFFAYCPQKGEERLDSVKNLPITLVPFSYSHRQNGEPYELLGMNPYIGQIISRYNIHCIFTDVFANYQFPMNEVPASIPFVLISPFGHFTSNGNTPCAYVSGKDNLKVAKKRGAKNAKILYNPLEDFAPEFLIKHPVGDSIVFGRIGRPEDAIFDPISVKAFKKLEALYGDKVRYIVVNSPPAWVKLASSLGLKNMEFRKPISDPVELAKFYREIDVLAHARKDGETVGMAIGEAMLAGNPVLTHKSHFHNDHFNILDSSYARWCEPDDDLAYFENMKWMVENKNQIRPMGQLARKRALEIFSLMAQAPKIIADFKEACTHYYHGIFYGRLKGYLRLYWENFKAIPFRAGKFFANKFPAMYKILKNVYNE
jgi:glycosyltransferase involved in cell wall biosynthesis